MTDRTHDRTRHGTDTTAKQYAFELDPDGLTTNQIAELTGFSASAIRNWGARFDIPYDRMGKHNLYMEDGQRIFQEIMFMKTKSVQESDIEIKVREMFPDLFAALPRVVEPSTEERIEMAVIKAVTENSRLAEAYGHAMHQIGALEERSRNLQAMIEQQDEKLLLAPGPDELERLKRESESVAAENRLLSERISDMTDTMQRLKSELEAAHNQLESVRDAHSRESEAQEQKIVSMQLQLDQARYEAEAMRAEIEQLKQELDAEKRKGPMQKLFKK